MTLSLWSKPSQINTGIAPPANLFDLSNKNQPWLQYSEQVHDGSERLVPAIDRALSVFEMLASSAKGLTLSQIARNLGIARSSAFYILNTLAARGYVHRSTDRGRYSFSPKLFTLANSSLLGFGIRERALPFLRILMQQTGLTIHLVVLSQNELVVVDRVAPEHVQPLATWLGKRMPIHCTGSGKALLAHLPADQVDRLIRQGLIRYNENTIVSPVRLRQELQKIRINGFAVDDEEETIGLRCVGAAVLDDARQPIAAISVAGTVEQIPVERVGQLAAQVKNTAAAIAQSSPGESSTPTESPSAAVFP